jgi:hypothetical protein
MAKKKVAPVISNIEEDIPTVDAGVQFAAKPAVTESADADQEDMHRKVKVILPVQVKVNRIPYGPGPVVVPAHMVDTLVEMVDKKKRADISVFTGNNYLVHRMVDRSLVVTKVEKI